MKEIKLLTTAIKLETNVTKKYRMPCFIIKECNREFVVLSFRSPITVRTITSRSRHIAIDHCEPVDGQPRNYSNKIALVPGT